MARSRLCKIRRIRDRLTVGRPPRHPIGTLGERKPGLGTVGATQNYTAFSPISKVLFVWLMMLGRLELFSILVLFSPRFWRAR